jgi:hypothetical protein
MLLYLSARLTNWPIGGIMLSSTRKGADYLLAQTLDGEIQQALVFHNGVLVLSSLPPLKGTRGGKLVANKFDAEIFLSISSLLCQVLSSYFNY